MKGYCLFDNIQINDVSKLEAYKAKVGEVVARYGGSYIILGGKFKVVEGNWSPTYLVMLEFPSYDRAQEWYQSDDYKELKALRLAGVESNGIIVEGL